MRIFNSYLLKVAPTVNISKYTLPTKLALLILKTLAGQMPGNVSEHRGIGEHGWFVLAAEVLTVWVSQAWDVPLAQRRTLFVSPVGLSSDLFDLATSAACRRSKARDQTHVTANPSL